MTGSADDGGEHSPGGIVTGEAGFAHAGAIVHNKSGNFVVTHDWVLCRFSFRVKTTTVGMGTFGSVRRVW